MPLLTENNKNIGTQKINIPKSFTVKLKNTEGSNITALGIMSVGCGACTTASISSSTLAPNGQAELNVIYKPSFTGVDIPRTVTIEYWINGEKKTEILTFKATSTN